MELAVPSAALTDTYYPDSDGKPLGETPVHVKNAVWILFELDQYFKNDPLVYAASNMFVYYEKGNRRRHVSPDVFFVRGIAKGNVMDRRRYLVWEEGKAPDLAIEITSESTQAEDRETKMAIYQDKLKVKEYFLFDPYEEYLTPRLQGFRLHRGKYRPIKFLDERLPSEVLNLHLEASEWQLRLYDPATQKWLPNPDDIAQQAEEAKQHAAAENDRLRRELEALRKSIRKQS
ncbi:MAG: Uma2 family endonuclease [Gemmataceae bacterium]